MKFRRFKSFTLATVTIGTLVLGAAVAPLWANTEATPPTPKAPTTETRGCGGGGVNADIRGFGMASVLEVLGIEWQDFREARANGKTVLDLADEKGFTPEEFDAKVKEVRLAQINELVKAGKITEEQAALWKERMDRMTVGENCGPVGGGCGKGFGRGMMGGKGFQGKFQVQ